MCLTWTSAEDVGAKVSRSLVREMKKHPRPGWVRAGDIGDPSATARLRTRIEELEAALMQVRTAPPPGIERLHQGSDKMKLRISYRTNAAIGWQEKLVKLDWDEIFGLVGPWLMGERTEHAWVKKLTEGLAHQNRIDDPHSYDTRLHDEDFQTIKIQLMALGLTRKSEKKREGFAKGPAASPARGLDVELLAEQRSEDLGAASGRSRRQHQPATRGARPTPPCSRDAVSPS